MLETVTPLKLPLSQTKNRCLKGKITVRFLGTATDLTAVSVDLSGKKPLAIILLKGGAIVFLTKVVQWILGKKVVKVVLLQVEVGDGPQFYLPCFFA